VDAEVDAVEDAVVLPGVLLELRSDMRCTVPTRETLLAPVLTRIIE